MNQVQIKPATAQDAELIADLSRKTFYDTFAAQNTKENMDKFMNEQFTKERLMKEVGQAGNIFFVAWLDGQAVGYLKLKETSKTIDDLPAIEIARIYAAEHIIGKGIGKMLMQTSIDYALQSGKKLIWLGVWQQNVRAIEFYKKWGFEIYGEHDFVLGDDVQKDWLMKKLIS